MPKGLRGWTLCTTLAVAGLAHAEARPIGLVKTATGEATIVRAGSRLAAKPGVPILAGDVLRTGSPGTIGVTLRDDTTLSLGSKSEAHLVEFVFEPAEGRLGMLIRVTRGAIGYVSGKIAKLAPEAAKIETPVATLGIRGTHLAAKVVR